MQFIVCLLTMNANIHVILNMPTPQDKIIEQLEAEILKLKTELIEANRERDNMKKQFDELKVILRET